MQPTYLKLDHDTLAYHQTIGKQPGIIFCGGFMSDMMSTKALALERFCQQTGQAFVRFDYSGHGQSSGKFEEGTITSWLNNALAIFDEITEGSQIIVGSSMGGWIALLLALARKDRVAALVGIASAPDFTEELIWQKLSHDHKNELQKNGALYHPCAYSEHPYAITTHLIEDGRKHLLLHSEITLDIPVRLLHGMLDPDVPWQTSLCLAEKLRSNDVRINLIKDGDHRLSRDQDIKLLTQIVCELL